MAPILKEADALVAGTATTTPTAPPAKSPTEAPSRPQPVALEIPVTVNGARTLDGSDKREPFSETTQTVLVFAHGAVLRVATPLVPGQLIFLTNEKSKKEVVCQVVKSKTGGSTSGYIELQFTEPAPGFWGLPASSVAPSPVAPRPAPPVAPAAPKSAVPVPPVATKPISPKAVAPSVNAAPPVKPSLTPATLPLVGKLEHVAPETSVPLQSVAPPVAVPPPPSISAPESHPEVAPKYEEKTPQTHVTPAPPLAHPAAPVILPPPVPPRTAVPVPALHDYSKEINALFAVPQPPASNPASTAATEQHPIPAPSSPSTEELRLQTARLQAQLGSLLFTESSAPPPTHSFPPAAPKAAPPLADVAKKVLDIAQDEPRSLIKSEPQAAPPVRKPVPLASDEEVKIPAWLAPLSQNSQPTVAEPANCSGLVSDSADGVSVNSEESFEALAVEGHHRSSSAVFGGQLLGEAAVPAESMAPGQSRKGLYFGLAAAALIVIGAGAWYFRQSFTGSNTVSAARPSARISSPASATPAPKVVSPRTAAPPPVNTANAGEITSSTITAQSSKSSPPAPTHAVLVPAAEAKKNNAAPPEAVPQETEEKTGLGEVHLAAPVVNHPSESQENNVAMPTIETNTASASGDPLAVVGAARGKGPKVPLPVGGDVKPAQLLKSVPPEYPPIAKTQRISGSVQIDALIDASGNVASLKVISGPPLLHRAAMDAVKQWKYTPAMLDGQPTSMHLTVTVQFRAQ